MDPNLTEAINDIIQKRRSIYPNQYEAGKKVDEKIILKILENANYAPTHKKTEPWRFTVFTDDGLKKFAELQVSLTKEYKPGVSESKIKKLSEYPLMASHIIAIGMNRSENLPEIEEILAVGCAIENMFLTATAYGLGAYLSTGGITYLEAAKPYFNLRPEDKLIGFFYIGHKKDLPHAPINRGDIAEKTKWVKK